MFKVKNTLAKVDIKNVNDFEDRPKLKIKRFDLVKFFTQVAGLSILLYLILCAVSQARALDKAVGL